MSVFFVCRLLCGLMMECSFQLDNGEPGVPVLWLMLDTYCFLFRCGEAFVMHLNNERVLRDCTRYLHN
jgi:hypothetical protein